MLPSINILLIDQNRYFAEGLRLLINRYFSQRNINVTYIDKNACKNGADLVFMAMDSGVNMLQRYGLSSSSRQCVFMIKERHQARLRYSAFVKLTAAVLSRELSADALFNLLELFMLKQHKTKSETGVAGPVTRRSTLTFREYEIMRHLQVGMNNHAVGRLLNISEKTVSSHKRSAMRKLNINRNSELHYWLLNGGLNTLGFSKML
jgi:DNA-binding NarL/FixJ family response regulator